MKKIVLLALALLAAIPSFASTPAPGMVVCRRHYDYSGFTELSLSHTFNVELSFGEQWSVDIEVPDFIEPYLKIYRRGNRLHIGLEKLPSRISRQLRKKERPYAKIRMPYLTTLKMSGASKLVAAGFPLSAPGGMLEIEISGASRIESLNVGPIDRLSIDMSGASRGELRGDFRYVDADLSGASRLNLIGNGSKIGVECSGASSMNLSGDYKKADIDISGSSRVNVAGNLEELVIDASGASKVEHDGVTIYADVELSGASKARIAVVDRLRYELNGASKLRLKDLGARIRGEASRTSRIEYFR